MRRLFWKKIQYYQKQFYFYSLCFYFLLLFTNGHIMAFFKIKKHSNQITVIKLTIEISLKKRIQKFFF